MLAKLPRSSSGSRDASASSRASRLPFDILEVSMTEAGFSGFALVSSAICFSGASNGDFISAVMSNEVETSLTFLRKYLKDSSTPLGMTKQSFQQRVHAS